MSLTPKTLVITVQHPGPVPQEWNYMRGGLSTIDRDYGMFNKIQHDIGTHVVHHLFPQIPHYHLTEATEVRSRRTFLPESASKGHAVAPACAFWAAAPAAS